MGDAERSRAPVAGHLFVHDHDASSVELPLGVRSVEWLRAHHGNWLVDEAEHVYYSWKAPKKDGPQLKSLPSVGEAADPTAAPPTGTPGRAQPGATAWPPPIRAVFARSLPGEGIWK